MVPATTFAAGTNFFVQGLSHPLTVPTQLVAIFSLGLLIGQQGWKHLTRVLPAFVVALAAGLVMTRYQSASWNSEMMLLPLAAIGGLLVMLKWQLPVGVTFTIAVITAVIVGMDSAVPVIPGLQVRKIYANLAGSGLTICGILLLISLIATLLRNVLQGVPLRILGAWATAGAVLVLTLRLSRVSGL